MRDSNKRFMHDHSSLEDLTNRELKFIANTARDNNKLKYQPGTYIPGSWNDNANGYVIKECSPLVTKIGSFNFLKANKITSDIINLSSLTGNDISIYGNENIQLMSKALNISSFNDLYFTGDRISFKLTDAANSGEALNKFFINNDSLSSILESLKMLTFKGHAAVSELNYMLQHKNVNDSNIGDVYNIIEDGDGIINAGTDKEYRLSAGDNVVLVKGHVKNIIPREDIKIKNLLKRTIGIHDKEKLYWDKFEATIDLKPYAKISYVDNRFENYYDKSKIISISSYLDNNINTKTTELSNKANMLDSKITDNIDFLKNNKLDISKAFEISTSIDSKINTNVATLYSKIDETITNVYADINNKTNKLNQICNSKISITKSTEISTLLDNKINTSNIKISKNTDSIKEINTSLNSKIDNNVGIINKNIADEISRLTGLIDKKLAIETSNKIKSEIEIKISTANENIKKNTNAINSNFLAIDSKINNSVNTLNTNLTNNFNTLDNKIKNLNTKFSNDISIIDNVKLNISNAKEISASIDSKINSCVTNINSNIKNLDSKINHEANILNTNKLDIDIAKELSSSLRIKISNLSSQIINEHNVIPECMTPGITTLFSYVNSDRSGCLYVRGGDPDNQDEFKELTFVKQILEDGTQSFTLQVSNETYIRNTIIKADGSKIVEFNLKPEPQNN